VYRWTLAGGKEKKERGRRGGPKATQGLPFASKDEKSLSPSQKQSQRTPALPGGEKKKARILTYKRCIGKDGRTEAANPIVKNCL